MKKIFVILLTCLILCGCQNHYERDSSAGIIHSISLQEAMDKMEQGDEFVVAFETDLCAFCQQFNHIFEAYIKNHNVTLYRVMLSDEKGSETQNLAIIQKYFPTFNTTPGVYYANEGYVVSSLTDQVRSLSEDDLEKWVVKYELDKKK